MYSWPAGFQEDQEATFLILITDFQGTADSPMAPTTCLRLFVSLFHQQHHSLRWMRWVRVPTSQLGTLRPRGVKEQPQSSQTLDLVILASASVFSVTLSTGDSLDNSCRSKGRHWFCWPWMWKPLLPLASVLYGMLGINFPSAEGFMFYAE